MTARERTDHDRRLQLARKSVQTTSRGVAAEAVRLFGTESELTLDDLAQESVPALVMAGDDDIIPLSHTARSATRRR